MFHVTTGLIALYVIWRLVWPLHCTRGIKWTIAFAVMLTSQHHLVTRSFFGSMASPEVPSYLLIFFGWAFGSLLVSACLMLVIDIGSASLRILRPRGASSTARARQHLVSGIGVAAMVLAAIGVWQAVRVPDVRTVDIEIAGLPPSFEGFRVVQLTDLHASRLSQRPWIESVVAKANALKPDLMVLTGDMVDGTVASRAHDVEPLDNLTASCGVFAVPGNHDYYGGYQEWITHFEGLGLQMLLNEHVTVSRGEEAIVLAGITDSVAARTGLPLPDVNAALAGVPKETVAILLSHRPAGAQASAAAGADLQLSGHTHGGHLFGFHWIVQAANEGYVSGRYTVGDMQLYVSHGAGLWAGFPVRLGRSSEITEIVLRRAR
jgi:predicted MPP superfamily phosphohydrolase